MPRVSVVTPVYNAAAYVRTAVASVLAQTEPDVEIVLVDDGSTDDTGAVLDQLAAEDHRVVVSRQPHTGKPSIPRNVGLSLARGECITLLDADDAYHPTKIARQLAVLDAMPHIGIVFHDYARFTTEIPTNPVGDLHEADYVRHVGERFQHVGGTLYTGTAQFPVTMALHAVGLVPCSVMFRRKGPLAEVYFREDLTVAEDIDFYFRLAHRAPVAYIDEVLGYRRRTPGSLSVSVAKPRAAADMLDVHRSNFTRLLNDLSPSEVRRYRHVVADHWLSLGYSESIDRRKREARAAYRQAFRLEPRVRTAVAFFKTFVPRRSRP